MKHKKYLYDIKYTVDDKIWHNMGMNLGRLVPHVVWDYELDSLPWMSFGLYTVVI